MIRTRRPLLALCALLAALAVGYGVKAIDDGGTKTAVVPTTARPSTSASVTSRPSGSAYQHVALSSLPSQVANTVELIGKHGPFPYAQDGVVFGNNERLLPLKDRGYYHEYTVKTPGSPDRGARRIIVGNGGQYYYTADHYSSFVAVDLGR